MDNLTFDKHTSAQFDAELEGARNRLMEMGGLVEQQLNISFESLMTVDSQIATRVIKMDKDVNKMQVVLDKETTRILAKRNPAASDLRFIIAVTKTVNELERMGDEATKIARQTIELSDDGSGPQDFVELRDIGSKVRQMVRESLDAFARLDVQAALEVMEQDQAVDREYGLAIRTLVTKMVENPPSISQALKVMWALRSLERIGDHARNIAESVIYLVKGKDVRHKKLEKIAEQIKN